MYQRIFIFTWYMNIIRSYECIFIFFKLLFFICRFHSIRMTALKCALLAVAVWCECTAMQRTTWSNMLLGKWTLMIISVTPGFLKTKLLLAPTLENGSCLRGVKCELKATWKIWLAKFLLIPSKFFLIADHITERLKDKMTILNFLTYITLI